MKIAVTTDGDRVFQHFGKCPAFTVFTVENGIVEKKEVVDASQNGHSALAGFLKDRGVDTVICGGIGDGARRMLASAGIRLFSGIQGSIDEAVSACANGSLKDLGGACDHDRDGQEQEHSCDCANHCE